VEVIKSHRTLGWAVNGNLMAILCFIQIAKRLEWKLLGRSPHEVSVFDDLSADPPPYMQARNTPAFPDFNGWFSGRALQQELQAALLKRRPLTKR
jgi:hypothetical protein